MLHVKNVIFDDEGERNRCRGSYETLCFHAGTGYPCHQPGEKRVVVKPEADDRFPRHVLVAVDVNPIVLSIPGTVKFPLKRGANETYVVVGRGIDQMPQFLL